MVAALGLAFNTWFVFLPSHLIAAGAVRLGPALGCAVIGLAAMVGTAPMMGRRSDRVGRRPVLIAAALAVAAFAVPGFLLAGHPILGLLVSDVVMGVLIGMMTVTAFVAELFPTPVRATGVALTYSIATAVFGGTAPLIATLLAVHDALWAMPVYLTVMALLVLVAAITARETAFDELS